MNNIKQVIVIRKDLNMRKGKMIAQGCHACLKSLLENCIKKQEKNSDSYEYQWIISAEENTPLEKWLNGIFTKICVYVNSEKELLEIYELAKQNNIICSLITDSGLTEFYGIPTNTCIALGPDYSEKIDRLTGYLKLL
jgi:PTH2 family peptidyl-tRNA hydrolase